MSNNYTLGIKKFEKSLIVLLSVLLISIKYSHAQLPCGTTYYKDTSYNQKRFEHLERNPSQIASIDVPIAFHIIRRSNGSGGVNFSGIQNQLSTTNLQYANAGFSFSECVTVDYIDDDDLYGFQQLNDETTLISHNAPNVLNIYYTNTVTDNRSNLVGGYSFFPWWNSSNGNPDPEDHFVIISSGNSLDNSTLSHEIGHFFGLLHTHETANGIELVNGSNCSNSGDGLCDTPADPNLQSCSNSSCQYTCPNSTDLNGDHYSPLLDNLMSYVFHSSTFSCGQVFTNQQDNRVNLFYQNNRSYLNCNVTTTPANDNCPGTLLISSENCNHTANQTVNNATASGKPQGSCDAYTGSAAMADVWYNFQAVCSSATITVDPNGSALDAVIIAYNSCSSNTEIDCSDVTGVGVLSTLTISTIPGNMYNIRVYDYGLQTTNGTFGICVTHSNCSGTEDINVSDATASLTTLNAGEMLSLSANQNYSGNHLDADLPSFNLGYYLSRDCDPSSDDIYLGGDISGLGSDDPTDSESEDVTIPANTTPGNYFIIFIADDDDELVESNETNNIACIGITILGTEDITVTNVQVNSIIINPGQLITVSGDQNYIGNQLDADLPSFNLSYYLSRDCNLSSEDIYLGGDVSGLGSDDPANSESEDVTIPENTIPGSYFIIFVADDDDELTESNEMNNIVCIGITILGIEDITVTNVQVNSIIINPGQLITVSGDQNYIGNQLDADLPSFNLSYYLSRDCNLSSEDIYLGGDVSGLGSDDPTNSESEDITIPANTISGGYFIIFVADDNNDLVESDENNNTACIEITIQCASPSSPTATAASASTSISFQANWNAVSGADGYYLDVSTNSDFSNFIPDYNGYDVGSATTKQIIGLTCNSNYYYRVRAYNSCGTNGVSNMITVITSPCCIIPSSSTAIVATARTSTSFKANWNVVSGAIGYYLDVATNLGFTNFVPGYNGYDVVNATVKDIPVLTCNTTYYYRVRAYNTCGTSGFSNTITASTLACCTLPSATIAVAASETTPTSFLANWNSVPDATGYYIDVALNPSFTNFIIGYSGYDVGNTNTKEVFGLSCNTVYYYRVRSYNTCGISDNSNAIIVPVMCVTSYLYDIEGLESFVVMPNPNDGDFKVRLSLNSAKNVFFKLYNDLGQLVYQSDQLKVSGLQEIEISNRNFNTGNYLLQTFINEKQFTIAVLIKN